MNNLDVISLSKKYHTGSFLPGKKNDVHEITYSEEEEEQAPRQKRKFEDIPEPKLAGRPASTSP